MIRLYAKRLLSGMLTLCLCIGFLPMTATAADIAAPADGNFTLLWVTDPQVYTNKYPEILSAQNDWILANANRLKVKYAVHTGDLVHYDSNDSQWQFVSSEYKKWDDAGFAYGVLQFLQEPYYLSLLQVCLDYLVAFAALGVAGFFRNRKNGLIKGYLAAVFARGVFASLAGYLFWMEYMPDSFPKSLTAIYPIVYNYMYLIAEAVLTVILLAIPAMKKAVAQVTKMAHGK